MTVWEIWTIHQPYFWITDSTQVFQTISDGNTLPLTTSEGNLTQNFPTSLAHILRECWNLNPQLRVDTIQISKLLKKL